MKRLVDLINSTVGKKLLVALTGSFLFLFVFGHMAGNLKAFAGVSPTTGVHKLDYYAEFLRSFGADALGRENFLWVTRLVLLLCLFSHIALIIQLRMRNRVSRESDYVVTKRVASSVAAQTMMYGGIVIFLFVVFHILHFTTGDLHFHGFEHGKVYANVYSAFQSGFVVAIYVVGVSAVSMHLYHGIWSVFQTLGLDSATRNGAIRGAAKLLSVAILFGFLSVPVAMFSGALPPPPKASLSSVH